MFPCPASYVPAKRNGGKLLKDPENFQYNLAKKREKYSYFICQKMKENGCKVTATVIHGENGDMIVDRRGQHTHDSDLLKTVAKRVLQEEVENARRNLTLSPRAVMANVTSKLQSQNNASAVFSLPKRSAIAKQVQRARRKTLEVPEVPKTWQDMKVPEALCDTMSGEKFLIMEENLAENRPEKILGFASPQGIEIMMTATQMFIDGTFEICETTLFTQLFIIVSTTPTGINVPTAFFFLPTKDAIGYIKILETLKNKYDIPDPPIMHCDFEPGILKAVKQVYPKSEILCCDTHFKRTLRKNLSDRHLLSAYNLDVHLQQFVRYFWALSLVPIKDIKDVWRNFVLPYADVFEDVEWDNVEPADLENYFAYLENTWIGGVNPRTLREVRPKFQHDFWNKNVAVLEDEDLTTNSAEGYNNQIKGAIPKGASLWTIIHFVIKEESLVALKLRDAAIMDQDTPTTSREKNRAVRKRELKEIVGKYEKMELKMWMETVAGYYNDVK